MNYICGIQQQSSKSMKRLGIGLVILLGLVMISLGLVMISTRSQDKELPTPQDSLLTLAPTPTEAYQQDSEGVGVNESRAEETNLTIEKLSRYGDDKDHTLYKHLRFLLTRSDDDARWISKLQEEIRKQPNRPEWVLLLAILYDSSCHADCEQAVHYFQKALKEAPQGGYFYLSTIEQMARCYVELGSLDSALLYTDMAIETDPSFAGYHYNKAMMLHAFGNTRAAITELNNYFAHPNCNKGDAQTYYKRAYYKTEIKDLSGALADVEQAMAKDSHLVPSAYLLRGDIYAAQGKGKQAKADYKTVLEGTFGDKSLTRVFALVGLGDKKQAMQILTDKIKECKELGILHDSNFYLLLRTLIKYGHVELARYFWEISAEWGYPYPCIGENIRVVRNNPRYKELQKRGINIL